MREPWTWRPEITWRFLAFLPLVLVGASLFANSIAFLTGYRSDPGAPWLLILGTALMHGAIFGLIWAIVLANRVPWRRAFGLFTRGWQGSWALTLGLTLPALGVAWTLHFAVGCLLDFLSIPHSSQGAVEAVRLAAHPVERSALFLLAALFAPVVEELLFRGILWPLARDRGWRIAGYLGVSFLFALIHFNLAAFLPLWLLGIFWIWLYERTGDLTTSMLSHALFNGTNFLFLILLDPPLEVP